MGEAERSFTRCRRVRTFDDKFFRGSLTSVGRFPVEYIRTYLSQEEFDSLPEECRVEAVRCTVSFDQLDFPDKLRASQRKLPTVSGRRAEGLNLLKSSSNFLVKRNRKGKFSKKEVEEPGESDKWFKVYEANKGSVTELHLYAGQLPQPEELDQFLDKFKISGRLDKPCLEYEYKPKDGMLKKKVVEEEHEVFDVNGGITTARDEVSTEGSGAVMRGEELQVTPAGREGVPAVGEGVTSGRDGVSAVGEGVNTRREAVTAGRHWVNAVGKGINVRREPVTAGIHGVTPAGEGVSAGRDDISAIGEVVKERGEVVIAEINGVTVLGEGVNARREGVTAGRDEVTARGEGLKERGEAVTAEINGVTALGEGVNARREGVTAGRDEVTARGEGLKERGEAVTAGIHGVTPAGEGVSAGRDEVTERGEGLKERGEAVTAEINGVTALGEGVNARREAITAGRLEVAPTGEGASTGRDEAMAIGEGVNARREAVTAGEEEVIGGRDGVIEGEEGVLLGLERLTEGREGVTARRERVTNTEEGWQEIRKKERKNRQADRVEANQTKNDNVPSTWQEVKRSKYLHGRCRGRGWEEKSVLKREYNYDDAVFHSWTKQYNRPRNIRPVNNYNLTELGPVARNHIDKRRGDLDRNMQDLFCRQRIFNEAPRRSVHPNNPPFWFNRSINNLIPYQGPRRNKNTFNYPNTRNDFFPGFKNTKGTTRPSTLSGLESYFISQDKEFTRNSGTTVSDLQEFSLKSEQGEQSITQNLGAEEKKVSSSAQCSYNSSVMVEGNSSCDAIPVLSVKDTPQTIENTTSCSIPYTYDGLVEKAQGGGSSDHFGSQKSLHFGFVVLEETSRDRSFPLVSAVWKVTTEMVIVFPDLSVEKATDPAKRK